VVEQGAVWVNFIQNSISVALVGSSEDNDFPSLLHLLEERYGIGADIEANLKGILLDGNLQLNVGFTLTIFKAVDECLIEIQYKRLPLILFQPGRQNDLLLIIVPLLVDLEQFVLE
jgi:hypothetical protein